jgi:outer membrane protein assembly factor BamB
MNQRYYKRVRGRRATTSCSAVALIVVALIVPIRGAKRPDPLSLFPLQQMWNVPLDKVLAAPPAFAGARAFVPYQGGVLAFDLAAQKPLWTAEVVPLATPAVGDTLIFVVVQGGIVALGQDNGAPVWRTTLADRLAGPLVWDNGWLIASGADGTIHAFRASDGELIWERPLGSRVHTLPALSADRVYVGLEDGHLAALSVTSGAQQWDRRFSAPVNDILALDDRLYVGSNDNFFYAIDVSDGSVDWRWRTGADVIGLPAIDDRMVYFVSFDNLVRALDRNSGAQRWKRALAYRPTRGPVRAGDELLVSGLAPRVSAFAAKDGAPKGDIQAPGELAAPPYVMEIFGLPQVVLASRDIATGARLMAARRVIDPLMNTPLPVLPNPITIQKPTTPASTSASPAPAGTPAATPPGTPAAPPPATVPALPPRDSGASPPPD